MHKSFSCSILLLPVIFIVGMGSLCIISNSFAKTDPSQYTYSILNTYPHDRYAFTQGLIYWNGTLFEGTGLYGHSSIRKVDLKTGNILDEYTLKEEYFGEGITIVGNQIYQLTWKENTVFIYDADTLDLEGNFTYPGEGWGLTFDGHSLIISNGTEYLTFMDPTDQQITGELQVLEDEIPVTRINELEFINGEIYANIWYEEEIAIIDPQTGKIRAWINLTNIEPSVTGSQEVLNGIAYDKTDNRLFVTGKNWLHLFEIELIPDGSTDATSNPSSDPTPTASNTQTTSPPSTNQTSSIKSPSITDTQPTNQFPSPTISQTPNSTETPQIPELNNWIPFFTILVVIVLVLFKKKHYKN